MIYCTAIYFADIIQLIKATTVCILPTLHISTTYTAQVLFGIAYLMQSTYQTTKDTARFCAKTLGVDL